MASIDVTFTVNRGRLLRGLVLAAGLLFLGSLVIQLAYRLYGIDYFVGLSPLFYLDREGNFPALYSGVILACAGACFALIARPGLTPPGERRYWKVLAVVFYVMAVDEIAQFHHIPGEILQKVVPTSGVFYFAWVIPATLFVIGFGLAYLRFWLRLPSPVRTAFAVAAILFLTGAIGMEMVAGDYLTATDDKASMTYSALVHVEEFFEMSGILVLLWGATRHLSMLQAADTQRAAGAAADATVGGVASRW